MKPIFQSTRRSRRLRQSQTPEGHQEQQTPFFSKPDGLNEVQGKPQPFFQAKLAIGQPGDPYEREADAVADAVVNHKGQAPVVQRQEISTVQRESLAVPQEEEEPVQMQAEEEEEPVQMQTMGEEEEPVQMQTEEEEEPVQMQSVKEEEEPVQMQAEEEEEPDQMQTMGEEEEPVQMQAEEEEEPVQMQAEEEEEPVQMKADSGNSGTNKHLGNRLKGTAGKGQPLPVKTRVDMENSFGVDFSQVNIHTDGEAVQLSKDLGAHAFTHGKDVYFNSGKYRPENSEGKHLLAHELTHVVQQGGTSVKLQRKKAADEEDFMQHGRAPGNTTQGEPQETVAPASDPALLSGANWVAQFPTSVAISDLATPFQTSVQNFYNSLITAGAQVSISATKRPPERAFLMHYAYKIARHGLNPQSVPAYAGVNINWWHGNLAASVAAAEAMVVAYDIVHLPSLTSKHIQGNAIDMSISWSGDLAIINASGETITITTSPRSGGNTALHAVGLGYGAHKLVSDPPHWSNDGS